MSVKTFIGANVGKYQRKFATKRNKALAIALF